ncbi:CTP synthase C-terminal region-related (seleno)protein [Frigoriglobus tundricola]|uniref:CTP synthase (glutamine hydrolyzing) n=1 Tax=Frigoriglobus tundricola TaxID=2774151 RepID=A0A6M5YQK5_9BACT|nr:CTP synthase [Frigoriglobus tundricola]QJW96327.1 Glutamine amidotransferase type-1 domain-containing protein [Frigoriglobus tundricola]
MSPVRIALVGDHNPAVIAHRAIPEALALAGRHLGVTVEPVWVHTTTVGGDPAARFADVAGVWCVPASPYADTAGALAAVRFAREAGRPFLGTCGGFQHALLEYAHAVLGMRDAAHAETDPEAATPLITPLTCSLVEQAGKVFLLDGSRLRGWYGRPEVVEGYHCRYGLNPAFEAAFAGSALRVSARDTVGAVRAVELEGHPFFVATLFQPERSALRGERHALVTAFLAAAQG